MQIRVANLIAGIRLISGPFGFLLAMTIGGMMMAFSEDKYFGPLRLVGGAIISGFLFHMVGGLVAMTIARLEYEISDERLLEDDNEEVKLGKNIDVTQEAENPKVN